MIGLLKINRVQQANIKGRVSCKCEYTFSNEEVLC